MGDHSHISVIIPVYNGARTLPRVLDALNALTRAPCEIIVVDDGSTDQSVRIAQDHRCRVLKMPKNIGAAAAKNRGAAAAQGDVLFFMDADILVPDDLIERIERGFSSQAVDAIVGVLAWNTPFVGLASGFKNLWMNYTYTRFDVTREIGLFYTSAAAMRKECFVAAGGFDEGYTGASTAEDTEFGQRAWGNGICIRLDPDLAVVHLKEYSPMGVLKEDFRRARALLLMRLRKWNKPFFTSVPFTYQLGVLTLYLSLIALLGAAVWPLPALSLFLLFIFCFYLLNAGFIRFLARASNTKLALIGALFLPLDAFAVGLGMMTAAIEFARGVRY